MLVKNTLAAVLTTTIILHSIFARKHIEELFTKYSDNGLITINRFADLLENLKVGETYRSKFCEYLIKSKQTSQDNNKYDDHLLTNNSDFNYKNNCLSAKNYWEYFKFNLSKGITENDLQQMCPAIIFQMDNKSCEICNETKDENLKSSKIIFVWIYSMMSVLLISLASVVCAVIIPCLKRKFYNHLLNFLVALGVGCMTGDAFLHLIPHAFIKNHSHDDHDKEDDKMNYYGLMAIIGIYSFFLFERIVGYLSEKNRKKRGTQFYLSTSLHDHEHYHEPLSPDDSIMLPISSATFKHFSPTTAPVAPINESKSDIDNLIVGKTGKTVSIDDHNVVKVLKNELSMDYFMDKEKQKCINLPIKNCTQEKNTVSCANTLLTVHSKEVKLLADEVHQQVFHDCSSDNQISNCTNPQSAIVHDHICDAEFETANCTKKNGKADVMKNSIRPIAWMIIIGDGLHNFCDGIAIGAAFSETIIIGQATAFTVLCHELPHEFGDFAVLLRSGMSVKRALAYNVLSSLFCFMGAILGIFIGRLNEYATPYTFVFIAGSFLYISLVHMFPEMTSVHTRGGQWFSIHFMLQNAGLLLGWTCIFVLSLVEHKIFQ